MVLIYFFIALVATTLGATAGLGGGVIIKPLLDTLGHYDLMSIGVLSSFTVLSMALVSTHKNIRYGINIEFRMVLLTLGAIGGGVLGKSIFSLYLTLFSSEMTAKGVQSLILALILSFVLMTIVFNDRLLTFNIHNKLLVVLIGLLLGTLSSFLGIGGGPINVAVLVMVLSIDPKLAAINSVFIILFSQAAKLISIFFSMGFEVFDLEMLIYLIPGGILGGIIGTYLNKKFTSQHITQIFTLVLLVLIGLNIRNVFYFLSQ